MIIYIMCSVLCAIPVINSLFIALNRLFYKLFDKVQFVYISVILLVSVISFIPVVIYILTYYIHLLSLALILTV